MTGSDSRQELVSDMYKMANGRNDLIAGECHGHTAQEWMMAALDLLDGSASPYEIHEHTGLPMERCDELSKMFFDATRNGWPRVSK